MLIFLLEEGQIGNGGTAYQRGSQPLLGKAKQKHYKEELLKIKQKLAEASGTSLEDIQVSLTVQMSIFIDKKKKRGDLGCSLNVGSSSRAT